MTKAVKEINLMESTIPTGVSTILGSKNINANPETDIKFFYAGTFTAIANFLSFAKSKEKKASLVINDLKGNLILAGIVEFHPSEEEGGQPNWTFEFTFDKEDLKDSTQYLSSDQRFQRILGSTLIDIAGVEFKQPDKVEIMVEAAAKGLKDWLEANAIKDDEDVNLKYEGFFLGTAGVEDGEKVISLAPDGALKKIIKDDAALEVAI